MQREASRETQPSTMLEPYKPRPTLRLFLDLQLIHQISVNYFRNTVNNHGTAITMSCVIRTALCLYYTVEMCWCDNNSGAEGLAFI